MYKLLIPLIFCTGLALAQMPGNNTNAGSGINLADHMQILDTKRNLNRDGGEKVDGSPYLNEEFQEGKVYTAKGIYKPVSMRYNIEGDYVEFMKKSVTYILDPTPEVIKVEFPASVLVAESFQLKGKTTRGFFVLLDSGKLTVLEKKSIAFRTAQAPKALESEGRPARYDKLPENYAYKINGGPVIEIGNLKKMIDALPDHKEEMTKFVSKERTSKNAADLTKFAKYYNQLQ